MSTTDPIYEADTRKTITPTITGQLRWIAEETIRKAEALGADYVSYKCWGEGDAGRELALDIVVEGLSYGWAEEPEQESERPLAEPHLSPQGRTSIDFITEGMELERRAAKGDTDAARQLWRLNQDFAAWSTPKVDH